MQSYKIGQFKKIRKFPSIITNNFSQQLIFCIFAFSQSKPTILNHK